MINLTCICTSRVFPCGTDSSCSRPGRDFKSSYHWYTCNTWRILDTTSYTILTLLLLPYHPTGIPQLMGCQLADACTQPVPRPYPHTKCRITQFAFGVINQVIGYPYGVAKSTGGSQSALIRFAFSGYAFLAGDAWNWSSYWSCLLSIETYIVTSLMVCIGFFLCGYCSLMHA